MSNSKFELYDTVRIRSKNLFGMIIDRTKGFHGEVIYVVDVEGPIDDPEAYPGEESLFDCLAEDLERI